MDEFVPVIDRSKPATVEKVDWGISSSEDEAGDSKSANTVEDPFKDDPFSARNDELKIEEISPRIRLFFEQERIKHYI